MITWRKTQKSLLLLFLCLCSFIFARDNIVAYSAAESRTELKNLPVLAIHDLPRLLVIAPHPDDETIGAGGVIQQALADGSHVKVVIVTNGDGQRFAPVMINSRLYPRPRDYIAIGERRQAEVTAALKKLGVPTGDIVFLGYPDRGTGPMWIADWNTQCPYFASYTRVKQDPYPDSYHRGDLYCGSNLLHDLQAIIGEYQPDLIILPHPADQHPDHEAVSNFTRLAVALQMAHEEGYTPELWGYIVHYGMFPQPRSKAVTQALLPPKRLMGANTHWGRVDLTSSQVSVKYSAIGEYSSQNMLLGKFLISFARRNELFESLPIQSLQSISFTTLPASIHNTAKKTASDLSNPKNEEFPIKGDLLTGWQTARLKDKLWLDLQMKKDIFPAVTCTLYLKLPDGRTVKMNLSPIGSVFSPRDFVAQIDLPTLGNPSTLAFAAEIRQSRFLASKTGWHILILK